jgi:hypothetical protein
MTKTWRRRSQYIQAKFRPYTRAIGELALAWNDFHERLGHLFVQAIGDPPQGARAQLQLRAIWGSITSDRQKRTILECAVNWMGKSRHQADPRIAEDVIWLVKRGHDLEEKRNNVIHAPLDDLKNFFAAVFGPDEMGSIIPSANLQNARAMKLRKSLGRNGPKLLEKIRFYRDYATALSAFARDLSMAWAKEQAWPERPQLPHLKDRS